MGALPANGLKVTRDIPPSRASCRLVRDFPAGAATLWSRGLASGGPVRNLSLPELAAMPRASRPLFSARRSGAARMSFSLVLGAVLIAVAGSAAMAQSASKSSSGSVCASYGAGFQRVPGTDSCVRSGAAVRTDAYGGSAPSNAPNQFNNTITPSQPSAAPDPWKSAR